MKESSPSPEVVHPRPSPSASIERAVLGGVPFDLVRAYDSITGKWTFLGIDADIVTSVGTQPNAGGALPAGSGSRYTLRPMPKPNVALQRNAIGVNT